MMMYLSLKRLQSIHYTTLKAKRLSMVTLISALLFFSPPVTAQSGAGKEDVLIEDELEEEFKTLDDEENSDNEIVVKGEDELLIRTQKSESDIVIPVDIDSLRWRDSREFLNQQGKDSERGRQTSVGAGFYYGLYNNFRFHVDASNQSKYGLFRILYNRESLAGVGSDGSTTLSTSSYESDRFFFSGDIKLSDSYVMGLGASFHTYNSGLQGQSSYSEFDKLAGGLRWNNHFNLGEEQTLLLALSGNYIEGGQGTQVSGGFGYFDFGARAKWQYIFPSRVSLEARAGYTYANTSALSASLQENHLVDVAVTAIWPLLLVKPGEGKLAMTIDLITGANLFYDPLYGWYPGPVAGLDLRLAGWDSRLRFRREAGIPDVREYHIEQRYQKLQNFSTARDAWSVTWKNRVEISPSDHLRIDGGFFDVTNEFELTLDGDGLYSLSPIYSQYGYIEPGYERVLFKGLYLEAALRYVLYNESVNLRSPLAIIGALRYESIRFDASLQYFFEGERALDTTLVEPYHNLGFQLVYRFNPKAAIYINGENLLNQSYSLYPPYREQGLNILGGIKINL